MFQINDLILIINNKFIKLYEIGFLKKIFLYLYLNKEKLLYKEKLNIKDIKNIKKVQCL